MPRLVSFAAALALTAAGCGGEEKIEGSPDPANEPSDAAATPPRGWRIVSNERAGFTLSVPRDWSVRTRESATLLRSRERVLALTVAADRSEPGRDTAAREYARRTFEALPGFRELRAAGDPAPVAGSPYESARLDGAGTLASAGARQRVTVAAFRRPGRVTYTVVAFVGRGAGTRDLRPLLASFRGARPRL